MEKQKRSGRTSKEQYHYYVEFLMNDEAIRTNKNTPNNPNAVEEAYEELANNLNAMGGPCRTAAAWKKVRLYILIPIENVFMKNNFCRYLLTGEAAQKKARTLNSHSTATGGGPQIDIKLSELETKLLDAIGRVVIDGAANVPEIGIVDNIIIEMDPELQKEDFRDEENSGTIYEITQPEPSNQPQPGPSNL